MKNNLVHAKNERLYTNVKKDIVTNQIFRGAIAKRKKKLVQFAICFHMISKGKPMTDYENMSKLLQFFDVKDFPRTHWYN